MAQGRCLSISLPQWRRKDSLVSIDQGPGLQPDWKFWNLLVSQCSTSVIAINPPTRRTTTDVTIVTSLASFHREPPIARSNLHPQPRTACRNDRRDDCQLNPYPSECCEVTPTVNQNEPHSQIASHAHILRYGVICWSRERRCNHVSESFRRVAWPVHDAQAKRSTRRERSVEINNI